MTMQTELRPYSGSANSYGDGRKDGLWDLVVDGRDVVTCESFAVVSQIQAALLGEAAVSGECREVAESISRSVARQTWSVYHGGDNLGLGRWSGPHSSWHDADAEATRCRQIVGGEPFIEADPTP